MLDKILIVIVLYKMNIEESLSYLSLIRPNVINNNLSILLYDNSPYQHLPVPKTEGVTIKYIYDPQNSGISKAYNLAARYAKETQKEFLLFLDQDSELPDIFFKEIEHALKTYPDIHLFAPILRQGSLILSPCRFKYMKGSSLSQIEPGIKNLKDISIFNSGILIRLDSFFEVGGYNEKIKLDFSDHYFISQFKKVYNQFVVLPVIVQHELSSHTKDEGKVLRRFIQYCEGVKTFSKIEKHPLLCFFWTCMRAIKLSIIFRNGAFIKAFNDNYIQK